MAIMVAKKHKFARAATLLEVMVATAVLVVGTSGALSYQYYSARDEQIAVAQITGTRTAKLLLEDWMSTGGSEEYNPTTLRLGFSPVSTTLPDLQGLGIPLNDAAYAITVDEVPMLVVLTWRDVAHDTISQAKLRQLGAIVTFCSAFGENTTVKQLKHIKPIALTTYVRVDASGG